MGAFYLMMEKIPIVRQFSRTTKGALVGACGGGSGGDLPASRVPAAARRAAKL